MTSSKTQATKATKFQAFEPAQTQSPQFVDLGALFDTQSDATPYVGIADDTLLSALGLVAPEGKEYKVFTALRQSKKGKAYLSIYLGLSDKR